MGVNSVSIYLRERAFHPLVGRFRDGQALDDPLCAKQAK